jgi:hypothetical protein
MNAYLQVLKQPYYESLNQATRGFYWVLLGVIVAICGGMAFMMHSVKGGFLAAAIFAATLAMVWVWMLLKSVVSQNTPANARLVPGMNRVLRQILVGMWLLCAFGTAAYAMTLGKPAVLGFALGLPLFIIVSLALRYTWARFVLVPMFYAPVVFPGFAPTVRALLIQNEQPWWPITFLLLTLIVGKFALARLLPQAGDAHWTWHQCLQKKLAAQRNMTLAAKDFDSMGARLGAKLAWNYNSALAQDCRARADGQKLLTYALGPQLHWTMALSVPLLFLAMWLCISAALHLGVGVADFMQGAVQGIIWGLLLSIGGSDAGFVAAIRATRAEQALLRMAPAAPQGMQLNQALARAILTRFTITWTATGVVAVIMMTLAPHGMGKLYMVFALFSAFVWPMAFQLRDYARLPGMWMSLLPMTAISIIIFMAVWQLDRLVGADPAIWLAFDVACLVVTAAVVRWRWKVMMRLPVAFPVGRIS